MGATYTRQSAYADGDTITSDHTNDEFDQLVAAFAAATGHTHDGTAGEGGVLSLIAAHSITMGAGTAGTDVTVTFDGESNDGVIKWMEDEDYFEFSDDILIASTEKLQFRDTGIYINSSADGQLDLVADTEIQIAATTIDMNGAVDISGNLGVGGNLTVTGTTTFNGGTITLGDAAGDNVVFAGDVDSHIIPDDDNTYDLGSSTQEWRDLYIDGIAHIDTLDIDENATIAGTLGVTGVLTGSSLDISGDVDIDGTTNLDAVDIDGAVQLDATLTVGADDQGYDVILYGDTASANLTWDSSADDLILNGAAGLVVPVGQLTIGSTALTSTATELNVMDGGTAASGVAVEDADRLVINDGGTMKQVAVTALAAYFDDEITAMPNLTSVGTLTALTVDDVAVDGKVITMTGSASDTAVITAAANGALSIVTTDAAGAAANIQITADGTAEIAGTTVTLDSSGGITLDADNGTITFADAGSSLGTITSSGYSGTAANIVVTDSNANTNFPLIFHDESNALLDDTGALRYNPSTGQLLVPNLTVAGTTTTVDTVTMQAANAIVFEGATPDDHETTLTIVDPTADRTISLPNQTGTIALLAAASNTAITSTPEELSIIDGDTSVGTTAVAGGDGLVTNDSGTVRQTSVDTFDTYLAQTTKTLTNKTLTTPVLTTPVANAGIQLKNGASSAGFIEFFEDSDNGTNKVTLIGPAATADVTLTLPSSAGIVATTDDATALAIALG
jgi:hypothetical protein|tara:strand:- start:1092 stop:3299 length:2208 start_codon:yes stop_codon:yes gene_type:complete